MSEVTYINDETAGTQCVVDCVAFFYKEGKGGENYRSKSKFRCHVNREEKTEKTFQTERTHLVSLQQT